MRITTQVEKVNVRIARVQLVPFGLCVLNVNWQTHYDGSTETDSFLNELNVPELHIANTKEASASSGNYNIA